MALGHEFRLRSDMSGHRRLLLALCLLVAGSFGGQACQIDPTSAGATAFPLSVNEGNRFLEDSAGRPFFMHGDTAWSLIAQLNREDAELYLQDRKSRGFNTILVNLLEHRFSSKAPDNIYGEPPFLVPGDYATPNEAYFQHADWILRRACELGFLVMLTPSYVGNGGGGEGWYHEMVESGAEKMRGYGRFVGARYRDLDNIVWVQGGDYDPPDKDLIRALVDGIRETDPGALHTAHGSPGSIPADYWSGDSWLAINNVYTYEPVHGSSLQQYARSDALPFFLMESAYENEHDAGAYRVRMQAYQAVLSGAMGHIFGNNPIWHFDGPGIYSVETTWQQELGSRGAQSMTTLHTLFAGLKWWLLEPDLYDRLLTGQQGSYQARATAGRARDGSFAVVYVPAGRGVTLDLSALSGPLVAAQWFDPANGQFSIAEGSPFKAGPEFLKPAPKNSAGDKDWILVLNSEADPSQ